MALPGCEHYCCLVNKFFRQLSYDVLTAFYDEDRKWFDRGKVRTRILIGPFSLYEVNHVSLASMFGSLPTIHQTLCFSLCFFCKQQAIYFLSKKEKEMQTRDFLIDLSK
jgi:hypothetical protein